MYVDQAVPICLKFDRQTVVFAARRALFSAGSRIPISTAMMPITTSSSTNVKPFPDLDEMRRMGRLLSAFDMTDPGRQSTNVCRYRSARAPWICLARHPFAVQTRFLHSRALWGALSHVHAGRSFRL